MGHSEEAASVAPILRARGGEFRAVFLEEAAVADREGDDAVGVGGRSRRC